MYRSAALSVPRFHGIALPHSKWGAERLSGMHPMFVPVPGKPGKTWELLIVNISLPKDLPPGVCQVLVYHISWLKSADLACKLEETSL